MSQQPIFNITKSPLPIIWLDTSIITVMAQWKHKLCQLQPIQEKRISWLYEEIYKLTRSGKIICPLAEQEAEVWAHRKIWLNTIHSLTLGIKTVSELNIHDSQFLTAIKSYVADDNKVEISFRDIFNRDPVKVVERALSQSFYITVQNDILFGKKYQCDNKQILLDKLNAQREKNVANNVSFEEQLEAELKGNLEAFTIQLQQFYTNSFKGEDDQFNATSGAIIFNKQLRMWEIHSGKSHDILGLKKFYHSAYYRNMPFADLSSNLYAKFMTDKQPIRSGDIMDIKHIYTLMPYTDLFITDKAMSTLLKSKEYDKKYNTFICYIGDTDQMKEFFENL
jgi:hypothetical protein